MSIRMTMLTAATLVAAMSCAANTCFAQAYGYGPPVNAYGVPYANPAAAYGQPGAVPVAYRMQPGVQGQMPVQAPPMAAVPMQGPAPMAAGCKSDGCESCREGCGEKCGSCGCCTCCNPDWKFYGDFMWLRATNAEVPFAVATNGPIVANAPGLELGPTAICNPDYAPAFRVGGLHAIDDCSSVGVAYSEFDSSVNASTATNAPLVLQSLVAHPSTATATSTYLNAAASLAVDYRLADLEYRHLLVCNEHADLSYVVGARFGHLDQHFRSSFTGNGTENVNSDINFDGAGLRLGLDGERISCKTGLLVYGRGSASFMAGQVSSNYTQSSSIDPLQVNTGYQSGRVVSLLDLELGLGWASCNRHVVVTGGYVFSGWYNMLRMKDYINAVQNTSYVNAGDRQTDDSLTFDGLTGRIEFRF